MKVFVALSASGKKKFNDLVAFLKESGITTLEQAEQSPDICGDHELRLLRLGLRSQDPEYNLFDNVHNL